MTKKQIYLINFSILICAYIIPLMYFRNNTDPRIQDTLQKIVFTILFIGSGLLVFINSKNKKKYQNYKNIFITFQVIGFLGLAYAVGALYLIFSFSHGIG